MEGAAALVAVDGAELGPAQGQVPVRAHPGLVDLDVEGAVHRLEIVGLLVDVHRRVHAVLVEAEVARGLPQGRPADVGGEENVVAAGPMALAPVLLDDGPDAGPLGVPEDEPAAEDVVGAEEVELGAEPAVVALLGLLEHAQVVLELLLRREDGAVDPLHLRAVLVALPVGPGDREELDVLEESGRRDVGAEAEVGERALPVDGHGRVALLADELDLERLALLLEHPDGLVLGEDEPLDGDVGPGQLLHALFDGLEVLGREGRVPQEVVIEPGLDGRADAGLGLGIEIEDGVGQEVRGAVPQYVDRNIRCRHSFSLAVPQGRAIQVQPVRRFVEFWPQSSLGRRGGD